MGFKSCEIGRKVVNMDSRAPPGNYWETIYLWHEYAPVLQKGCSASIQFSVSLEIKAEVRAYKIVGGRCVYGEWSKVAKKKIIRG